MNTRLLIGLRNGLLLSVIVWFAVWLVAVNL